MKQPQQQQQQQKAKLFLIIQTILFAVIAFWFFKNLKSQKKVVKKVKAAAHINKVLIPKQLPACKRVGQLVVVETPLYTAKFSTVGARLVSFYVKKYHQELVSPKSKKLGIYPFTTLSSNKTLSSKLASLSMKPSSLNLKVEKGKEELTFKGKLSDGRVFEKEFTFKPNSYLIIVKQNLGNGILLGPDIKKSTGKSSHSGHIGPIVCLENGKVIRVEFKKDGKKSFSNVRWAGEEDKYFIMAVKDKSFTALAEKTSNSTFLSASVKDFQTFVGPKEYERLKKIGMDGAIDFGIIGFLVKPLLLFFLFMHKFIPNYGLVIIVLTLITKIIFHPLTHKSFESMKKMQEITPKIDEIKKRYKKDPKKMNEEIMKLYKEEGVNPLSGCLPMLLQIPIFFALYELFLNAVELKGASFLWLKDLSAPDPTYVLPVLMGISMIIQQKLTPATNPEQQKIFYVMAIVFTFLFAKFPAGLVLYWFVNNVISAAQNFFINRMISKGA